MYYFIVSVCCIFTFRNVVASESLNRVFNTTFNVGHEEGLAVDKTDHCKKCKMPKSSQFARLVLMNALNPPYAALQVPSETALLLGTLENTDFHSNSSGINDVLDNVLGSPELRQFARSVLKNLGEIGTTELLEDCCWAVHDHVCFALHSADGICSSADADHILTASRANGECVLVLQQGNDDYEMQIATAMKGQITRDPEQMRHVIGPRKLHARTSGAAIDGMSVIVKEFEASTTLPVYDRWLSLASSTKCQRVYMAGFSMGTALAQYHRFDTGIFRNDGLMSDTCKFGDEIKECSLYMFGTLFPFQGDTKLELASCSGDYSFVTEDDLIAGLPETTRNGIFCPSCLNTLRSKTMHDLPEFSLIVGVRSYQLRRNLGVWLSSNPPRILPYAEAVEMPCKMSPLEWMKTTMYIERNESYTHGPLGEFSHPHCIDVQYLAATETVARSTSCGHYCHTCMLWGELLLTEEAPDIVIPMPSKSPLHDAFSSAMLPIALAQAAIE